MRAMHGAIPAHSEILHSIDVTLLELVQAVGEVTDDDREVVATVCHMIRSGRVRLCGNFRGWRAEALR